MATNTGKGYRRGAVDQRSQFKGPNGNYVKRGSDGKFMDQKPPAASSRVSEERSNSLPGRGGLGCLFRASSLAFGRILKPA